MLKSGDDDEIEDYSHHVAYRMVKRFMPVFPKLNGHRFTISKEDVDKELQKPENAGLNIVSDGAKYFATPLLLCLAVVEVSDIMFAFDSVPAVIAVSREPIIIYSAMIFAILGLRSLYFVLEAMKKYLVHLEKAVIVLLFYIGFKLGLNASDHLMGHGFHIEATTSLYIVLIILSIGIVASVLFPEKDTDNKISQSNS